MNQKKTIQMKYLLKQPLFHFLLIGIGLFVLFELTDKDVEEDIRSIVVDRDTLLTFMQFRSRSFDKTRVEKRLEQMPEQKLQWLINDFVREEVLYREALAMALDRDDYVIRRRLVQKLRFITKGLSNVALKLDDEGIRRYFEKNKSDYYLQPRISFTHVFFKSKKRGREPAQELAEKTLAELNQNPMPVAQAVKQGDYFLYKANHKNRMPEFLASRFGKDMTQRIFELKPDNNVWRGPFESLYGFHLVMVTANQPGRSPEIDKIYEQVKQDAQRASNDEKTEKTIQAIIDNYDIRIVYQNQMSEEKNSETAQLSDGAMVKTTDSVPLTQTNGSP
jgi:hypothetical protein